MFFFSRNHRSVWKVLVAVSLWIAGSSGSAQSLLWEISGNGLRQPSYVFGTFHVLKSSYVQQTPKIKTAFDKAQGVVVETTLDSSGMLQMAMRAMMPDKNLKQLISAEDYALVADEFKKATGADLAVFGHMKPIMTATMLSMSYVEKQADTLSTFTGQPLDMFFATEAKRSGKTLTALETMEQQMTFLFDHDPVEKQAADLVQMVKEKENMQGYMKRLTDFYLAGDLDTLWKMGQEYEQKYGDLSHLVRERNEAWMKKLPQLMDQRATFIAVGALHLPGPDGLLTLLRKAGYKTKPL